MSNESIAGLSLEHIQHKRMTKAKLFNKAFLMFIGAALVSVALEIFLVPNNIIDGGIVGISIMLAHFVKIPIGIFSSCLTFPFFS